MTSPATDSKLRTLEEAAETIADGSTIAIGGLSMNSVPMAFIRTLARRKVRDLTVVAIVHGMPIEWLVAAGCVRSVVSGLVSLEGFGLAPRFRAAVQAREIEIEEYSEHTLICRLQAAAYHIPYMPTKAGLGTDMLDLHPDTTRAQVDAATGDHYVACTPLPVDVAIVHAEAADERGNVRVDPKLVWMDSELVKAAATTIVTVERIVPEASFRAEPHRTTYPRFTVETVVEAPWGAYPDLVLPALLLRRRLLPRLRGRAHRPRRRPGLLGRADRRAGDARRVPGRQRRPAHAPLDRPEDDVSAEYTIDELMVTTLVAGVHERHARLQRSRLLRPRLRLPARPAHARARSRLGRELDRDRRRSEVDSRVDALGRPLGRRQHARQLGLRLLGLCAEPPLQHLRLPRRPDGRLRQRQQHDDRAVRVAEGAAAGRRRDGGPELHDPAHLPLVDDPRRTNVRREARLPLRESAGATAATTATGSGCPAGLSSASRTSASSPSIRTRSGCRSAASTPASAPSR